MAIYEIQKIEVKHTGTFMFKEFYVALHDYIFEDGYCDGYDDGFPETYYWESRTQTRGREYWIWWRCTKSPAVGPAGLVRYILDVDIHGVGVKDVEIMYKNRKLPANKGKCEIIIRAKLEIDIGDAWKNSSLGWLRDIYVKKMWRKQKEQFRKEVVGDMMKLRDTAADFIKRPLSKLKAEPYLPRMGYERENF